MNKKGNTMIIIILSLAVLAFVLVTISARECNSNNDCSVDSYCGADNSCHQYPNNVVLKENSNLLAAFVLGIAMLASVYLYKTDKLPFLKK